MGQNNKSRAAVATAAGLAAILSVPATAKEIDEIIVTTRYKEESLQEVPIAVTAVGVEAIERRAIDDLFKLAEIDPSVSFDTSFGPGDTRVSIRGLSNTRGRSNVAFLVDGVDVTSENQIAAGSGLLANQRLLADIERIEIVKGPQSALYGRAAFAGAIAYTTKNPTDTLTGSVGLNFAENDEMQLRGAFSGPLTDTLGFRVDGLAWTSDGVYKNSVSGSNVGGGEGWGSSFKLRWEPSDAISVSTRVAYSEDKNDPRPVAQIPNDEFVAYNEAAIAAGFGVGGPFGSDTDGDGEGNGYRLGVVNHGTFCPDLGVVNDGNPNDPDFANTLPGVAPGTPGICRPGNIGSISDLPFGKNSIAHSETLFGDEQEGSTLDLFRASVNATWDTGKGQLQFIGGYTDAAQTDEHDQDFDAFGRPDRIGTNDPFFDYGGNISLGHQQADTDTDTRQISGELRFSTDFDGPVNAIIGYLRWDLKVAAEDRNYIANCLMGIADLDPGTENVITGLPTISDLTATDICDGGNVTYSVGAGMDAEFFNGDTYNNWQQYMQQFVVTGATAALAQEPRTVLDVGRLPGSPWQSDTDHQSLYLQLDWDISEDLKLTTEARWVDERFTISRPNQSSCSNLAIGYGFNSGTGTRSLPLGGSWVIEGSGNPFPPLINVTPDLNCSSVNRIATFDEWRVIDGFEEDDFIVPKATLEWFWADEKMVYFSWAKAQKPGGINQLAAGGSAVTIDDLRFDAEKMTTWEIGTKTSSEFAGSLTMNAALFYNDYTDKQVSTQVLDSNGSLQPRVLNASSADVLGVELDMTWLPSAIDGLLIRAAYTWQEGEYNDFLDRSSSAIRAGGLNQCNVVDIVVQTPSGPQTEQRCEFDLSGKALERQARNAFSASFNYTQPFGDTAVDWFIEGDTSYTDRRYLDQDNYVYFDDYWLTNFRLGLQGDTWDTLIFVDNAFDDDTIRSGGSGPEFTSQSTRLGFTAGLGVNGYFGILPNPRIIGIRTNFRFGD